MQFLLIEFLLAGLPEVDVLEEHSGGDYDAGEHVLNSGVLGGDEDDEHEDHEDVGVDAQEVELHLVVYHLHPVVRVHVLLVLYVVEHQRSQDQQQHDRSVEAEEGSQ